MKNEKKKRKDEYVGVGRKVGCRWERGRTWEASDFLFFFWVLPIAAF